MNDAVKDVIERPCRCGSDDLEMFIEEGGGGCRVECMQCGISGPWMTTKPRARAEWNRLNPSWHPMTDEPEGGEEAMIVVDARDQGHEVEALILNWKSHPLKDGWASNKRRGKPFTWAFYRDRYPNALWAYLPERGQL